MNCNDFVQNNFTNWLDQQPNGKLDKKLDIDLETNLCLDLDKIYSWLSTYWHDAWTVWYEPKDFITDDSNHQTRLANQLGYTQGNTLKRDWGRKNIDEHNQLLDLIGQENLNLLDIDIDKTLVRCLVFMPGQMLPLHRDNYDTFCTKFSVPEHKCYRYSVLVNQWNSGQYLQIHDKMITNWKSGDVYKIPNGIFHCSGNGGILPKITFTITGVGRE